MKNIYTAPFILVLFVVVLGMSSLEKKDPGKLKTPSSPPSCSCGALNITFNNQVPGDAALFGNQTNADCFGWAEFISLNWPADGSTSFGDPANRNPVQWEGYIPKEALFTPNGTPPPPWGTLIEPEEVSKLRAGHFKGNTKLLMFENNFETESPRFDSTGTDQAFPFDRPSWLGAQNNTNIWYEVRLNKDIYDYVKQNGYYNALNQLASVNNGIPILFPKGVYNGVVGAIEIKAAWMEVNDTANIRWKRYKTSEAIVIDANTGNYRRVIVALVGLHILHKTSSQPSWVWATFEQVDNVPGSNGGRSPYNFYSQSCTSKQVNVPGPLLPRGGTSPVTVPCTPNTSPGYYLGKGGPRPLPIQAERITPIDQAAQTVNKNIQDNISRFYPNSVWKYYELVNVIWSTSPRQDPPKPVTTPVKLNAATMQPKIPVANTTLETYIQGTTCTGCHTGATIAATPGNPNPVTFSDFSFAIGIAGYPVSQTNALGSHKKNIAHVPFH